MLTELMIEHIFAYHATAIGKLDMASTSEDHEQYAYWYGFALGLELALDISGDHNPKKVLIKNRKSAGFDETQSPVREI